MKIHSTKTRLHFFISCIMAIGIILTFFYFHNSPTPEKQPAAVSAASDNPSATETTIANDDSAASDILTTSNNSTNSNESVNSNTSTDSDNSNNSISSTTPTESDKSINPENTDDESKTTDNAPIVEDELLEISIKTHPKTHYIEGNKLDLSALIISEIYKSGKTIDVAYTNNKTLFSFSQDINSSLQTSDDNIEISYKNKSVSLPIVVEPKSVIYITLENAPTKNLYYAGESVDVTGGTINICYNNGTEDVSIDMDESMLVAYETTAATDREITINYQGKTATFTSTWVNYPTINISGNTERTFAIDEINYTLPSEYTPLKYAESDGSQSLDTGIMPVPGKKYEIKANVIPKSITGEIYFIGTDFSNSTHNRFTVFGSYQEKLLFGLGSWSNSTASIEVGTEYNIDCILQNGTQTLSVNGASYNMYGFQSLPFLSNIKLFGDVKGLNTYYSSSKIGTVAIYEDDQLIWLGTPVKNSTNTVGYYDFVSESFIAPASTPLISDQTTAQSYSSNIQGVGDKNSDESQDDYIIPITIDSNSVLTDYEIHLSNPLYRIGNTTDTLIGSTITRKIGKITLSAGTTTISDAMPNSQYISSKVTDGVLDGQDITLPSDSSDIDIYYIKAIPTTETIESLNIPVLQDDTPTILVNTTTAPISSSLSW